MLPGYTAKEIFANAALGQQPYGQFLQKFLSYLKIGVTSMANIFDPDVILLGGGLSKGIEPYLPEIQTWLKEHAFPAVALKTKITTTKFANQSGAIGAALLALESSN